MRRGLALFALWGVATATIVAVQGCYGNNCGGGISSYGRGPGEGRMLDENTWESSPEDGVWLGFPGDHLYFFEVPQLGDRKPMVILPYISPVKNPNVADPSRPPSNFTLGGGNLSEISGIDKNRFNIHNGTCADYFLRVVVMVEPRPPQPPAPVDAGADASDAAVNEDAAADAATDAPSNDAATDAEAGP